MAAPDTDGPVVVSGIQVRAAKQLLRLRGANGVHPVVRIVAGLDYEQQVFKAVRRHQPAGADLRRQAPLEDDVGADILLDDGHRLLVLEALSAAGRVDAATVRRARANLRQLRDTAGRPVDLVLVSRSRFTAMARRVARTDPVIRLVTWIDPDDDDALAAVLDPASRQPDQRSDP